MTFQNPLGFIALAALPIILWLHLRRRRPRPVVVPSLAPWLALIAQDPPSRRRVPPSVLLALHLAVAALLGLALAGPVWTAGNPTAQDRAIVLDTTTSMQAAGRWGAALARVRSLIAATSGHVTLATLGPQPRVVAGPQLDRSDMQAVLDALAPGGTGARVDEALRLAVAAAGPGAEVVVVTDGGVQAPELVPANVRWELVGPGEGTQTETRRDAAGRDAANLDNVAIVNAAARTVAGETRLFVRVAGFQDRAAKVPLALTVDGHELDRRTMDLAADGTFETVWNLPAGARTAEVRLDGRDALAADDVAVVPLEEPPLQVQLIGESDAVARALQALPEVRLVRAGMGSFRADGAFDVSVFVGRPPPDRLPPGGVVLFEGARNTVPVSDTPMAAPTGVTADSTTIDSSNPAKGISADRAITDASVTATVEAARFATTAPSTARDLILDDAGDHPLLAGLDLSGVLLGGAVDLAVPVWAAPVLKSGGLTVAYAGFTRTDAPPGTAAKEVRVVAFGFDPDAGSLARRLAFPLLVGRAVAWAAPPRPPAVVPAGALVPLPLAEYAVQAADGARLHAAGEFAATGRAGLYSAQDVDGSTGRSYRFGVLAGDAQESNLRLHFDPPLPVPAAATPTTMTPLRPSGRPLWPILIAAALAVMLGEGVWRASAKT